MNKQISIRKATNGFILQVGSTNPHINEAKEILDKMTSVYESLFRNGEGEEWKDNLKNEEFSPLDVDPDGEYIFQDIHEMVAFIMDLFG